MRKLTIFLVFVSVFGTISILFAFFPACTKIQNNTRYVESIQIRGSDTIVNLIQAWSENFVKQYPNCNISVTGGGSGTGFASLINKTCDITMSSRKIEKKEKLLADIKGIKPVEFKIGIDGLAVLVNKNNPVSKLTLEQLRDIFMAKITNWKEVGGENKKIVVLSRESNSGTHMFFKERVLRNNDKNSNNEFSMHSLMMSSSQAIYDEVYQNSNALGYVGMGFINNGVKAISVAINNKDGYGYPNLENVMNGKYPISRPLYLYTNGEPYGVVEMFIKYALSDEGQNIVLNTDFAPIKKLKKE
ncbi:MAG: phosphate ABC transporter substrate-binding protein [Endomicrobium sp.]|jgi:phosphate transport system substrate-binding protein|nr:phosphate ABC transporter substrate-binding protein [Endomicrobium sp.]